MDNVKEKIMKLLAKAGENPNDNETICAMAKAQELMAKYKISESEVIGSKKGGIVNRMTQFSYATGSSNHYIRSLADIIAKNFCCMFYINTQSGHSTHYISFIGTEEDVSLCEQLMFTADQSIRRGCKKIQDTLKKLTGAKYIPAKFYNPYKVGYTMGFVNGLKTVLENQVKEHEEWGIILSVPNEAKNFIGGLKCVDTGSESGNDYFYCDGYSDGSNFMNKKVTEGTAKLEGSVVS